MRTLGAILFLFVSCIPGGARESIGIPQVSIQESGARKLLEIRELAVSVEVHGWLAETVYELEVFNHTNRRQEGEFSLQLPDGATVSTWAIDIEGKMRPAVAVEKERALHAYETIKRQMIDPGIVERQEGNIYRTRIFPLPPEGTRRIRIGFIRRLGEDGRYVLPLRHDEEIGKFSWEVRGTEQLPTFGDKPMSGWSWSAGNFRPDGELAVQAELPSVGKPVMRMDQADGETCHFVVQGRLDPQKRNAPVMPDRSWKSLRLLWDASYSGRFRDHEKEIAGLHELWKWLGDVDVTLHVQGYGGGKVQVFQVRDGKADALENFLRNVTYDGALDLRKLGPFAGATVLVTDGGMLSPALRPENSFIDNFHVLSFQRPDPSLHGLGGLWADFGADWLAQLQGSAHLVRVDGMPRDDYDVRTEGDRFIVTGKVGAADAAKIRVHAAGNGDIRFDPIPSKPEAERWSFIRRAWAQRRLEMLEQAGAAEAIKRFAMSERLASDHTSLIVLERFQDHVTYRIPPPEPGQLALYEAALKREISNSSSALHYAWNEKRDWHKTEFPWVDESLREEANLVAIWVKSSRAAFPPEKLNTAALKPYENWLAKSLGTLGDRDTLETSDQFGAWRKEMDRALGELTAIRAKGADPAKGEPVHVSVRGFVKNRGVYSSDAPTHLSEAIKQAGGANSFGQLNWVFLYRDARRFGYNILSGDYKDVPLRWGDMIVVEREPYDSRWDGVDPFAAAPDPVQPREQAATFDAPIPRRRTDSGDGGPFGGGGRPSPAGGSRMEGEIQIPEMPASSTGLTAEWRAGYSGDAAAFHRELLGGEQGRKPISIAMAVGIAGILYEKGNSELAEQVLSNLMELYPNPVEGTRSFAYWLDEHGSRENAVQVLTALRDNAGEGATRALVSHDLGRITGGTQHYADVVQAWPDPKQGETAPAVVALTDFFAVTGVNDSRLTGFQRNPMPSDLRVVVTMAGGNPGPHMIEPIIANSVWSTGAYEKSNPRVYEFQVRRAWPGEYKLMGSLTKDDDPVTVRIEWFHHWGTARQTKESRTILLEEANSDLGSMDFGWGK